MLKHQDEAGQDILTFDKIEIYEKTFDIGYQ